MLGLIAIVASLYVLALTGLYISQRRFIYPAPQGATVKPPPGFRAIDLVTADGFTLRAAYRPASGAMPTILFFHGNGDSVAGAATATQGFVERGYGVLLPEYRGYAGNPGSPEEQGLYRDGDAAFDWLTVHGVAAAQIVVIGNSLGSGVATEMAVRHRLRALVLVSGFASMAKVVAEHLPFVPAELLVRDRYDNAAKIGGLSCPVLLLHGTADRVVPVTNGATLKLARPASTLELVPGAGHELAYRPDAQRRIIAWLSALAASPGMEHSPAPPISGS
jgi:hypothetical protein